MRPNPIYIIALLIILSSCAKRNLVYFSDIEANTDFSTKIPEVIEPRVQPDDLLKITVTSLSPESNLLFNSGVLSSVGNRTATTETLNEGYLVDKNGEINFPVLGMVKLAGLTKPEAIEEMSFRLREYVKDPIVNI